MDEGQPAGLDGLALIHEFVGLAVDQQTPVPRRALRRRMLAADPGGAVGGDRVIPARRVAELVDRADVFEKPRARLRQAGGGPVEIRVLAFSIVRPDADHVPLVGGDVGEVVLSIESADRGIALPLLFPGFDRETKRCRVGEPEADNRVRHPRRAPIIDEHVDAGELREAQLAGLPARGEICFCPVVKVPDVVNGDFVALDFRPRDPRHVGLPLAVRCRLEREPPAEHDGKPDPEDRELAPARPHEPEHRQHPQRLRRREQRGRPVVIQRAERPGEPDEDDQNQQRVTEPTECFHEFQN